jgi:predicted nucleic acid-binding protein
MRYFIDSYFHIAFLNPRDSHHAKVRQFKQALSDPCVTTMAVLLEVCDALAGTHLRRRAIQLIEIEQAAPRLDIIPFSDQLLGWALNLYRQRLDKAWSLTDCISFVVMQEQGISEALTGDHHFAQAGFQPIFARNPIHSYFAS